MKDYATKDEVQQIVAKAINEAVGEIAGLIHDMGQRIYEVLIPMQADIAELKKDVAVLKKDVAILKIDVATLKKEMKEVRAELKINTKAIIRMRSTENSILDVLTQNNVIRKELMII